ncbi:RNA-directed DNA polymerase, eukaryota, partial [Tanacetum coccineum]
LTDGFHCHESKVNNKENQVNSDPFDLERLILKSNHKDKAPPSSDTPPFPPGFSPKSPISINDGLDVNVLDQVVSESRHNVSNSQNYSGFSMIARLEETIKVGIALGFNMEGCFGDLNKRRWVKDLCSKHLVNFLALQETKSLHIDLWVLRQLWGNIHFDFASSSARGKSGGILCVWNNLVFHKSSIRSSDNYLVVEGLWVPKDIRIMWTVVYAPQELSCKISLWSTLFNFISNWEGILVAMGDFNEVRYACERFGSSFNDRQADIFNSFIVNNSLFDIPLGGYNYTWTDKWGSKMSKLDRFLVSESILDSFPYVTGIVLEKGKSDHRPILLKESMVDFGPSPFRFFHSWPDMDGFSNMVKETWINDGIVEDSGLVSFKKKLQILKHSIRLWIASKRSDSNKIKLLHFARLAAIDVKIDNGCATDADFLVRIDSMKTLGEINRIEVSDLCQKSKLKWARDGDENSSFFHGSLKRKMKQLAISDFIPLTDILLRLMLICLSIFPPLSENSWKVHALVKKLKELFRIVGVIGPRGLMASRSNSSRSFRIYWKMTYYLVVSKTKKELLIFKVDFEKAFDSIRWDFLDLVMDKLGFGSKWRVWIQGCLSNARASVLVNGSPTEEFEMFRGLRQGDPLSPFLFILVMEGLHAITRHMLDLNLFNGALVGQSNLQISHLMYADDINVHKSNIIGVNVSSQLTDAMAKYVGCKVASLPLNYLGVSVGCNMSRGANWLPIIWKFSSKLAHWKVRLLSVGGRLSLIKSVLGNLPTYYMSLYLMPSSIQKKLEMMRNKFFIGGEEGERKITWVKWEKCLSSRELGGLGIGSIHALNLGLIFKWIWRFLSHKNDLWARVISNIYGIKGGINEDHSIQSSWGIILSSIRKLKLKGLDVLSMCKRKLGNGILTSFWDDDWCGIGPLKILFSRIYLLDLDKGCNVANRLPLSDWSSILRSTILVEVLKCLNSLICYLPLKTFRFLIKMIRGFGRVMVLLVLYCRLQSLALNKLPSRVNLDRKGIDMDSVLCPICCSDVETVNHVFFTCEMANGLWSLLARWWEVDIPICSNFMDWCSWIDSSHLSAKAKCVLDGVGGSILWAIWRFRNQVIFSATPPLKATLWDFIVSHSFLWISSRNSKFNIRWVDWLKNPLLFIDSM